VSKTGVASIFVAVVRVTAKVVAMRIEHVM
jgi:hypothetical protein